MNNTFDVVIVGAGAAGIAAARHLAGTGLSSILLEASQRVGGRAWTADYVGVGALDLGCGWLHSADRNDWLKIAERAGTAVDRTPPAWGTQYNDLGFSAADQDEARTILHAWKKAMSDSAPASDNSRDAALTIEGVDRWLPYLNRIAATNSGKRLEEISIKDYITYLQAEGVGDFRPPFGFGRLVSSSLPSNVEIAFSTPITKVALGKDRIELETAQGPIVTRTVILTVSTNVLASDSISFPQDLQPWLQAARDLSLGQNEKVFLEILQPAMFGIETRVIGNPYAPQTGAYYIRPLGKPVIEGFFSGEAAEWIAHSGPAAAYNLAMNELVRLFGEGVRSSLRPLAISAWGQDRWIQGSYSCAAPGKSTARPRLAMPFDDRIFFAGEATHSSDFSTAHGAYGTGLRAAEAVVSKLMS